MKTETTSQAGERTQGTLTKITPAPWTLDEDGGFYLLCQKNGKLHGLMQLVGANEANARLVSASPDLLSSLERIVGDGEFKYGDISDESMELAREAIRKARGISITKATAQ